MARDNQLLGNFRLKGIKRAMRGVPQIEVTFDIDVNGILNVSAKDLGTGKEQSITITTSSSLSDEEIEKAMEDAKTFAAEDEERKEAIHAYQDAENMIAKGEQRLSAEKKELSKEEKKALKTAIANVRRSMKRVKRKK
jgi:molecular chaperone DnaK